MLDGSDGSRLVFVQSPPEQLQLHRRGRSGLIPETQGARAKKTKKTDPGPPMRVCVCAFGLDNFLPLILFIRNSSSLSSSPSMSSSCSGLRLASPQDSGAEIQPWLRCCETQRQPYRRSDLGGSDPGEACLRSQQHWVLSQLRGPSPGPFALPCCAGCRVCFGNIWEDQLATCVPSH